MYELKFEIISEICQDFHKTFLPVQKMHKNCRKQLLKGSNVKQILQEVVSIPSIRSGGDKENNKFHFKLMCSLAQWDH